MRATVDDINCEKTKIAAVIPVHNRRETTLGCLRRLQTIEKSGFDIVAVVVDDGSTDNTSEAVKREFPDTVVIKGDGNLWWAESTNKGVEFAVENNFDYVLTLNDDIDFERDFLAKLVETASQSTKNIVGSIAVYRNSREKKIHNAGFCTKGFLNRHIYRVLSNVNYSSDLPEMIPVKMLAGYSVLIPTNVYKQMGYYNSKNFPQYGGDSDLTLRAQRHGFKVFINTKSIIYVEDNSFYPQHLFLMHDIPTIIKTCLDDRKSPLSLKVAYHCAMAESRYGTGLIVFLFRIAFIIKYLLLKVILTRSSFKKYIQGKVHKAESLKE